ncbi:hypothetical protein FRC11_000587, partial [Ceratobasidium sp. 423]
MLWNKHWVLQNVHLSIIANSLAQYSHELTLVTQALLKTMYWAQLPCNTNQTLQLLCNSYTRLHDHKDVWIKNKSCWGKKDIIPHFNIPKFHMIGHLVEQILAKGTANNFSMEVIKHMHMDTLKDTFPATNRKGWEKQMIYWPTHQEKILRFLLFQTWRKAHSNLMEEGQSACDVTHSQLNYGLQDFQDITLKPANTLMIAKVEDKYGVPGLLQEYQAGGYLFATGINHESCVQVLKSL